MKSKIIPKNVHFVERLLRVIFGLFVVSLLFWGPESYWALLGLIPVFTGIFGSCPLYTLFGVSTCRGSCKIEDTSPDRV
jgi:DUF2892 family protein